MPISDQGLPYPQRRWAIVAISLGTALVVIDNAIATIALPTIADALGAEPSSAVGIVTIYQMVLLMALLPFSALGDRIGHKRMYQNGQLVFVAASLLCLFADNLPMLLVARASQALGVAAVLSVSSALLRHIYPSSQLGRGFALNSIIIGSAAAFAPAIGGIILSLGSWQWVFAAAAPFAMLSLFLGRSLPNPSPSRAAFDVIGAGLCALMFGALIGGLETAVHAGPVVLTIVLLSIGGLTALLFIGRERRRPYPILPVDLLARPAFALPVMAALLTFAGLMNFTLSLPFRLHAAYGLSPGEIGAIMAAWPIAMLVIAPFAGSLSDRTPGGLLGGIGMMMAAASFLLMTFLPAESPGYIQLAAPLLLGGAGAGLFISPNSHLIMRSTPPERSASSGALISTTRLTGSALGATILAGLLAADLGDGPAPALVALTCALCAALCSFMNFLALRALLGDDHSPP